MCTMHLFLTTGFQLAVTVLLIVPLISATPGPSPLYQRGPILEYAGQQRDTTLPPGWAFQSCFTNDLERLTLSSIAFNDDKMTPSMCVIACNPGPGYFGYAGLENGNQCYCGNITTAGSTKAPDDECRTPCGGDNTEFCGGKSRLSLYSNGRPLQRDPTFVREVDKWSFTGCYNDSNDARTLSVPSGLNYLFLNVTVEKCLNTCDNIGGYAYAGVEVGAECWCGSSVDPRSYKVDEGYCKVLACSGNSLEYCGAAHSITVYNRGRV